MTEKEFRQAIIQGFLTSAYGDFTTDQIRSVVEHAVKHAVFEGILTIDEEKEKR